MRTIELGVTITDAAVEEEVTTIFCAPVARDPRCPDCGRPGRYRDTVIRPLTDLPVAGYPLVLRVAVPRYRCTTPECGRAVFNQDLGKLAAPCSSTTRRCARYVWLLHVREPADPIPMLLTASSWNTTAHQRMQDWLVDTAERCRSQLRRRTRG